MRHIIAVIGLCLATSAFAATPIDTLPTDAGRKDMQQHYTYTCAIKGVTIVRDFHLYKLLSDETPLLVLRTLVNDRHVAHAEISPYHGTVLYTAAQSGTTGWTRYDSSMSGESERAHGVLLATIGITGAEWDQCQKSATKQ